MLGLRYKKLLWRGPEILVLIHVIWREKSANEYWVKMRQLIGNIHKSTRNLHHLVKFTRMFTSWQTYQTYQNGCILMVVTIQSLKFEFSCLCTGPPHEGGRLYTVCVCFFSDILPISVRPKAIFSDSPDISADKSNCLFTHIYHILVQHSMYVCPSVASFRLRYWVSQFVWLLVAFADVV